ncbi:Rv3235 family protein [Streptomyces sp. NPDC017936]|uniref:Rv3235 family protein n=1 Tax=Streptomyces sp. NPDC017936 TaxID=3365016 RepID=UPI00379082AF
MNKVMTRTQHTAGTRPPGRRDTRRPAGTPPRTPNGLAPRTAARTAPPTGPARTPHRPLPQQPQPRPTDLFADRLLAVLSGRRPVHSMLRHTLGRAYDDLAHLAERGPLRTPRGIRPVVRDIGYYVPRPGAIEAFARIGAGDRLRAMAFRLELGTDHRWRCTAVELGGPRGPRPTDD